MLLKGNLELAFGGVLRRPRSVVPAIVWTWLTFSGTYAMANGVRSCCTAWSLAPAVYVACFTPKPLGKELWKARQVFVSFFLTDPVIHEKIRRKSGEELVKNEDVYDLSNWCFISQRDGSSIGSWRRWEIIENRGSLGIFIWATSIYKYGTPGIKPWCLVIEDFLKEKNMQLQKGGIFRY